MKRNWLLVMTLLLVVSLCAACGSNSATDEQTGTGDAATGETAAYADTLTIACDVDATYFDPRLGNNITSYYLCPLVFSGLIYLDNGLEVNPDLATNWEISDDGLTYTFYLREGIKFHDGSDLTAADIKYTYDMETDPDFGAKNASLYTSLESVDVINDYTVQFNLNSPCAAFLTYCDLGIVPENADEDPEWLNHPIGCGPYQFVSRDPDVSISLAAFADYWDGEPAIKNIVIKVISESSTRVAALEAGDVDMIYSTIVPSDVIRLRDDSRFVVDETSGIALTQLSFSVASGVMGEEAVRAALMQLVDKELISETFYEGVNGVADCVLINNTWSYPENGDFYTFDPEAALATLAEAGWTDHDGDSWLDRDGAKLTFTLCTHAEDSTRIQICEFLQNQWQSYGIDVQLETYEWSVFYPKLFDPWPYDVALHGTTFITDPDRMLYNRFHSTGGNNFGGYKYAELDELLESGRAELDQDARADIYAAICQFINDKGLYLPIVYESMINIHTTGLEGFSVHPAGYLRIIKDCTLLAD